MKHTSSLSILIFLNVHPSKINSSIYILKFEKLIYIYIMILILLLTINLLIY